MFGAIQFNFLSTQRFHFNLIFLSDRCLRHCSFKKKKNEVPTFEKLYLEHYPQSKGTQTLGLTWIPNTPHPPLQSFQSFPSHHILQMSFLISCRSFAQIHPEHSIVSTLAKLLAF